MTNILFIDTETTGFKKSGLIVKGQARVCQIAMVMADQEGRTLASFSCLVKPDGWEIGEGAYKTHGISQQDCEDYGLEQRYFVNMFLRLVSQCKTIVAHNETFDKGMIEIELAHSKKIRLPHIPWYCTQKNSVDVCKIPPTEKMIKAGRTHYKAPNLAEALEILTGKRLENAHDAMADTLACKDIFFALKERGITPKVNGYGV